MLYSNGSFEICQERIFVKQRRKNGWSSYLLPKKIFMLKQKSSNLYKIYSTFRKNICWVIIYALWIGIRSQMLYTNGSFEICQERMFVKQRRTHGWSNFLLSKKIFMLKQTSSNFYVICFNSVKMVLSNYLCTLHWHAFTNALHKRVIWNLPRANVCEAASKTRLK